MLNISQINQHYVLNSYQPEVIHNLSHHTDIDEEITANKEVTDSIGQDNIVGLRQGIRYMTNGLKVYYLPLTVCFDQVIYPTLFAFFPLFRNILIRYQGYYLAARKIFLSLREHPIFYLRILLMT